ncbi:MAG TPA: hypothetical protein VEB21_04605 [Terriglobales bacterium]|nr:hypothetical protein [Terriglobales bacterium]
MSATEAPSPRCHHCGAHVQPTIHTRDGYRVGFYELYTGAVEEVTHSDELDGPITFQRLVRPEYLVTCADCYRRPEVREEREKLFYTERS